MPTCTIPIMSLSNQVDNEAAWRSYNFQLVENVDNTSSTIPWPKHRSLTAKYDNKNTIPLTANINLYFGTVRSIMMKPVMNTPAWLVYVPTHDHNGFVIFVPRILG